MINILVFGDSNSWGYTDEDEGKRYDKRWPIELSNHLANARLNCSLKEDSLPGRTTNINDMQDGSHLKKEQERWHLLIAVLRLVLCLALV